MSEGLPAMSSTELGERNHVELFAGAGGLALGLKLAGFQDSLLVEADPHACRTLRANAGLDAPLGNATVLETDVRMINWATGSVDLLSGGAPCQPFSLGGNHRAEGDVRNLFPEVLRAMRELNPRAVLLENVKGLTRKSFRPYFDYLLRQLRYPDAAPKRDEDWIEHDTRLRNLGTSESEARYDVYWRVLNAADYGVPQSRDRVFVLALPRGCLFRFPKPTHARLSPVKKSRSPRRQGSVSGLRPWVTVRQALHGLPEPSSIQMRDELDHWLIPGARTYVGHSGSHMDRPSKTIKAGVHGVPGGENTVVLDDGQVRYYTLREIARIQSFPDDYRFPVSRSQAIRQIGNAVPCRLAWAVGQSVWQAIHD